MRLKDLEQHEWDDFQSLQERFGEYIHIPSTPLSRMIHERAQQRALMRNSKPKSTCQQHQPLN